MSQIFNFTRFLRLVRAHWAESWKAYAWFFGVCAILNGIFLAMALSDNSDHQYLPMHHSQQAGWYLFGLIIAGLVFATRYFEQFSNTGSTLILLMRPASVFEKWCLALLFVVIFFPLAYTLGYACMNYPVVAFAKSHYVALSPPAEPSPVFRIYIPFSGSNPDAPASAGDAIFHLLELVFAFKFSACLAICMSGRVFFKRAAVLKTWMLLFGLLLFGFFISEKEFGSLLFADIGWVVPKSLRPTPNPWDAALAHAILFGVPVLVWTALFFHIREREVS